MRTGKTNIFVAYILSALFKYKTQKKYNMSLVALPATLKVGMCCQQHLKCRGDPSVAPAEWWQTYRILSWSCKLHFITERSTCVIRLVCWQVIN